MVGRRPQHVVSKFAYLVLFSARWFHSNTHPNRLSIFLLVFLVISPYGFQVVMRIVHLSSLSRLMCPAQDHFILLVVFITSVTPVFALTQVFVFLSWYVILSILLSIFVCAGASFFLAFLALLVTMIQHRMSWLAVYTSCKLFFLDR